MAGRRGRVPGEDEPQGSNTGIQLQHGARLQRGRLTRWQIHQTEFIVSIRLGVSYLHERNRTPEWDFTFLHWFRHRQLSRYTGGRREDVGPEPSTLGRFQQMAALIQERVDLEQMSRPTLFFHVPGHPQIGLVPYPFRESEYVDAPWLLAQFERFRRIYPEIQLEGLMIRVMDMAHGMQDSRDMRVRGGSRFSDQPALFQGCRALLFHGTEEERANPPLNYPALPLHRDVEANERDNPGLCGLRAFLLLVDHQSKRNAFKYKAKDKYYPALRPDGTPVRNPDRTWLALLEKTAEVAARLGWAEREAMGGEDFKRLLQLDDYKDYRVVILSYSGRVVKCMTTIPGETWLMSQEAISNNPAFKDPKSIYILQHLGHFFAIGNMDTFMRKVTGERPPTPTQHAQARSVTCRGCFTAGVTPAAQRPPGTDPHRCPRKHYTALSCGKCQQLFRDMPALQTHEQLRPPRELTLPTCGICGENGFHGEGCWEHHKRVCFPKAGFPTERCPECTARVRVGQMEDHVCQPDVCTSCRTVFPDREEYRQHRCELQRNKAFWNPVEFMNKPGSAESAGRRKRNSAGEEQLEAVQGDVTVVEEGTVVQRRVMVDPKMSKWHAVYAYDFETTRSALLAPDKYKLAVMGWWIRLVIPCGVTAQYVQAWDVLTTLETLLGRWAEETGAAAEEVHWEREARKEDEVGVSDVPETLLIWGDKVSSFYEVVHNVLTSGEEQRHFRVPSEEGQDGRVMLHEWHADLWAHNGSKFDAKFVLDEYLDRNYEVAASGMPATMLRAIKTPDGQEQLAEGPRRGGKRNVVSITNVGSRLLSMSVERVTYRCSAAHLACRLAKIPGMFGKGDGSAKKGMFPYKWLKPENHGVQHARGLPPLCDYDTPAQAPKERAEIIRWWIEEQQRRNVPREEVLEILHDHESRVQVGEFEVPDYIVPEGAEVEPWDFTYEFWTYLKADVDVLAEGLEAYHSLAEQLHEPIWAKLPADDKRRMDRMVVSPLSKSTSPGWAFDMYTTWFMPEETVYLLRPMEHEFVRASLKGGRTDMRANYMEVTPARLRAGDRIQVADVTSLYPSVMDTETPAHEAMGGTYYPTGVPWWINNDPDPQERGWHRTCNRGTELMYHMNRLDATGFLNVTVKTLKPVTHPTLSHKGGQRVDPADVEGEGKLLFANQDIVEQTYGWPELKDALEHGEVELMAVHRGLLFKKGYAIFHDYIRTFFKIKERASQAETYNEGLRALAKLLLNSLWGKLGQRAYPQFVYVSDVEKLDELYAQFDSGKLEPMMASKWVAHRALIQFRDPAAKDNVKSTAPQLAASVSMWGRVILKQMLRKHGQRVLYCDTDSVYVYMRAGEPDLYDSVERMGGWEDDSKKAVKDQFNKDEQAVIKAKYQPCIIRQMVCGCPKTYAVRYEIHPKPDFPQEPVLRFHKAVSKGFEATSGNAKKVNYFTMKARVFYRNNLYPVVNAMRAAGGVKPEDSDDEDDWMLTPEEQRVQREEAEARMNQESRRDLTFLTTRERKMEAVETIVEEGKPQFVSSLFIPEGPSPVERLLRKAMTMKYDKGKPHPHHRCLVVPFGDALPNEGKVFIDYLHDPDPARRLAHFD